MTEVVLATLFNTTSRVVFGFTITMTLIVEVSTHILLEDYCILSHVGVGRVANSLECSTCNMEGKDSSSSSFLPGRVGL